MPTVYLRDALDYPDLAAAVAAGWVQTGTVAPSMVAGRTGSALRLPGATSGAPTMTRTLGVGTLVGPKQISFWHRRGSTGAATICRVHTAAGAQVSLQSNAGFYAVVRGDGGASLGAIQGGNSNYLGGQTGVWWHVRWVFEAADAGMNEVHVDGVLRYAGAGGDHQQQGSPGFDRVRLAAFTPFLSSAGYQHDFDDLVISEPGVLDQGRRRRAVSLG
jgi:hypothetical protein